MSTDREGGTTGINMAARNEQWLAANKAAEDAGLGKNYYGETSTIETGNKTTESFQPKEQVNYNGKSYFVPGVGPDVLNSRGIPFITGPGGRILVDSADQKFRALQQEYIQANAAGNRFSTFAPLLAASMMFAGPVATNMGLYGAGATGGLGATDAGTGYAEGWSGATSAGADPTLAATSGGGLTGSGGAELVNAGMQPPPPGTYQASGAVDGMPEGWSGIDAGVDPTLTATGGGGLAKLPLSELKNIADVTKGTSLGDSLTRLLSGTSTAADLAKLGMTAAGAAALLADNPDRTTTSQVQLPDWYTAGSKSALALADKYAALGPDSVAPLSDNETQAIQMAKDSAGNWQPLLDRSSTLADEAAGGIPSIDLSKYMNPYLDNVLKPIARRNEIAKAGALQDINAKAGMRGAFGGSRNDLLTNLATESADRNLNEAEANIRSGAFTTGLNAAQSDLNRKLSSSGQFRNNASTMGALTDADISHLASTGGLSRGVAQAKLSAPLAGIGGYATALRGSPGSTSTTTAPEASKIGQAVGGLTALAGASKYGLL